MSDDFTDDISDDFTDVSTEGYGSRLGGSLIGMLFGLVLLPLSVVLLFWNEGRAVNAEQALSQGAKQVVEIDADQLDSGADGKLVHLSGTMTLSTPAKDPLFGATGDNLARVQRKVEMYQWKEDQRSTSHESVGGSKTTKTIASYSQVWSSEPINSGSFKHPSGHNNPEMPIHSETFNSDSAKLGAYHIGSVVLDKLSNFQPFTPELSSATPSDYRHVVDGYFRGTGSPDAPEIGDLRVTFGAINAQPISVVAGLSGDTLAEYHGAHNYAIVMAQPDTASASELFKAKKQQESKLSWIFRGVGCAAMAIGFLLIGQPVATALAFLPFMEGIAETGVFLIALILTLPLTLLTIAVAWIAHRPVLGGGLLIAAAGLFWLLSRMRSTPQTAVRRVSI
jgi:hypothetical protein